jgi:hypothetical protein
MVKFVGKTKSAPYAATPENFDPSGSRATVILKGSRFGADNCCGATADERPMLAVIRDPVEPVASPAMSAMPPIVLQNSR